MNRGLKGEIAVAASLSERLARGEQLSSWAAVEAMARHNGKIRRFIFDNYYHRWIKDPENPDNKIRLSHDDEPFSVKRREIARDRFTFASLLAQQPRGVEMDGYWNTSLASTVLGARTIRSLGMRRKEFDLPLMDMDIPVSDPGGLSFLIQRVQERLVPEFGGFVVSQSGNSYHLIGTRLLSKKDLYRFYGACLLMDVNKYESPDGQHKHVADRLYVAHDLYDRDWGALRITASANKPTLPTIVAVIPPQK